MWMGKFVRVGIPKDSRIFSIGTKQGALLGHCHPMTSAYAGMIVGFASHLSSLRLKRPPTIFIHKHTTLKQSAEI